MDTFNKELSDKDLKKLICPNCGKQFGSKKLMKCPKKFLHPNIAHDNNIDIQLEDQDEFDYDLKGLRW